MSGVPWGLGSEADLLPAQRLLLPICRALGGNWGDALVLLPKEKQQSEFPCGPAGNSCYHGCFGMACVELVLLHVAEQLN